MKDAIDAGYRHIDGAMMYENEEEVGAGINAKIEEGVIKRDDIFVTSKVSGPVAVYLPSNDPRLHTVLLFLSVVWHSATCVEGRLNGLVREVM